jgi:RHS repeat-associated protein
VGIVSIFRSTTALIALAAYAVQLLSPALAYAQAVDDARRIGGGSLSSGDSREDSAAVGMPSDGKAQGDDAQRGAAPPEPSAPTNADGQTGEDPSGKGVDSQANSGQKSSAGTGPKAQALALPGGDDKTGVSAQAISIPKGAGSLQGMEESFSAQLSTGIATFSIPFALPKARGGAQPSLGLSYSSAGGLGEAGQGWSVGVPFIARQTDRGIPRYDDRSTWHANQDRFVFNGGQELVPICTVSGSGGCSGRLEGEVMPVWASGFQYFRPRVEGSFLRFFWSPDHRTWVVQDKSGVTMELGYPLLSGGPAPGGTIPSDVGERATEHNPDIPSEVFRWSLVRQYDQHLSNGTTGAPLNVVLYDYAKNGEKSYVTDIYDSLPVSGQGPSANADPDAPLASFAHRTRLVWEGRTDQTFSYRSGFRIDDGWRLTRVDVSSKTYLGGSGGSRRILRRYHLGYRSDLSRSLLASVQVEGRCAGSELEAPLESATETQCPRLPPMVFGYTEIQGYQPNGKKDSFHLPGFQPFDGRPQTLTGSPPHSIDDDLTDFFDIDSDSLPDVLVTAPGLYSNGHAVFFNGAEGARGFGGATNLGIRGVLGADAGTLKLSNLNVSPQDFDGDGRINLLHMPRVKKYSAYDPRQIAGQWTWVGREIETASGQNSKIDFGKDTRETQILDVDFDGLVDVLVATGTELQTFFSLGRYPSGDGQFGHASWATATNAQLSNSPVATCVPHSGTAVSFGDGDIRLGDMNGDGIADIVRVRRGDIRYWPGRGNGFWGTGRRDDCRSGTFGSERHLTMAQAPEYSDIQGSTIRLSDVNGDGLDDLVQINFDSVDLYLNVNGVSWTKRHILDGTPHHAGFQNRVRLIDVNGSGTADVLWGDANSYKYIDLAGGQKPYVLSSVENGLGKRTELEYSTSAAEMLAAEARGACNRSDPWAGAWCEKMPTVAHVVKKVTELDQVSVRGRPPAAYVTEYEYRDPVFEGRQREFRGFRQARATRLGDENSPADVSESVFLLGECLGADGRPWDGVDQKHACAPPLRWRDNAQEALKGLPIETHSHDRAGVHQSSSYNQYRVRTLYQGLDGRSVRHAFLESTDALLYDTGSGSAGASRVTPTSSSYRSGFVDSESDLSSPAIPTPGQAVPVPSGAPTFSYASGMAHLRNRTSVDAFGNKVVATAFGCVGGAACPSSSEGAYLSSDETISTLTMAALVTHPSGWLWRTAESSVVSSARAIARNETTTEYDNLGRPVAVHAELVGTEGLDRADSNTLLGGGASDGTFTQSRTRYDVLGNAIQTRAANGRCAEVLYDASYGLFAGAETIFTTEGANSIDTVGACAGASLTTTAAYDMGLGAVTLATDLNQRDTLAVYDEFGRITALHKPSPSLPGGADPTYSPEPSVLMEYLLPGCAGCASSSLPAGTRHSIIHTRAQDGADESVAEYLESYAYVDGFGRTLVTLSEADETVDGAPLIAGSLLEWDAKGAVSKKYLPFYYSGSALAFDYSDRPTTSYGRQRYDAFGRQTQTYDLDGTVTLQSQYHALSTDLWDAADLYPGPHQGSYASERKDGHSRTVQTTERFRDQGKLEERRVRTVYLPTGEPEVIARVRTGSDPVVRWMRYDSLGRMVLNVEPNTTKNFTSSPTASAPGLRAWRYQYNFFGDLIGTSDARGCGQNFFYDGAGRILGEDYAPCEAHHAAYSAPSSATDADALEVSYYYDDKTAVPSALRPAGWEPEYPVGRAVAVLDRASAGFTEFDGRGRTQRTLTRVANPTPNSTATSRYAPRVYARSMAYDAADREVEATTGLSELAATQGGPTGPLGDLLSAASGAPASVTTSYSRRGAVQAAGSSYGSLITNIQRTADNLVTGVTYGDIAGTQTSYLYDERRRISSVQTYRGPPSSGAWTQTQSTPEPTQQLVLQDEDFRYDVVGNPIEIRDWRDAQDWPDGAKPVTKKIQYDDLYRATRVDYQYSEGDDEWTSPFKEENEGVASSSPLDPRRALPSPHVEFSKRILRQSYDFDWLGNTDKTTDDAGGFYDRSLGTVTNDTAAQKPYQLKSATLSGARGGSLSTKYDDAGQMIRMDLLRSGPCLPTGATCSQRFAYDWDEVGRLSRARRWDATPGSSIDDPLPGGTPAADLRYQYDAGDQRVIKHAVDASGDSFTLYVFESLEFKRSQFGAAYSDGGSGPADYEVSVFTIVPYLLANGVRLARLAYEGTSEVPEVNPGSGAGEVNASVSQVHVFFELGDHLGSTSVVLDKATGELVERSTFQGFGATESDYRTGRWNAFREDYRFTGKEEDAEVGLIYFGKRYLNAYLGRWISADPLAIHAPGEADLNVYAYVSGSVLRNVDPLGLEENGAGGGEGQGDADPAPGSESASGVDDAQYGEIDPTNPAHAPAIAVGATLQGLSYLTKISNVNSVSGDSSCKAASDCQEREKNAEGGSIFNVVGGMWQALRRAIVGSAPKPAPRGTTAAAESEAASPSAGAAEVEAKVESKLSQTKSPAAAPQTSKPSGPPKVIDPIDIVGKKGVHGPQAGQEEVNPDYVRHYQNRIEAGERLDPVHVLKGKDGRQTLVEGHHRYVAGLRAGRPVEIKVEEVDSAPVGSDWAKVEYVRFHSESFPEH